MLEDFLSEVALVDVHVNLGSADVFVSEHRLDGSQICPSFQELRGKTVPEGVRADAFPDSRFLGILFDIDEEGYSAEVFASSKRDENVIFLAWFHFDVLPHDEPLSQLLDGVIADGHKSFLPSFTVNADVTLFEIELAQLQANQFAD